MVAVATSCGHAVDEAPASKVTIIPFLLAFQRVALVSGHFFEAATGRLNEGIGESAGDVGHLIHVVAWRRQQSRSSHSAIRYYMSRVLVLPVRSTYPFPLKRDSDPVSPGP